MRRALMPVVGALALLALSCTTTPTGAGGTSTTVPGGAPSAVTSASPTIGDAPLTVHFDSSGSTLGTGTGLTYLWNFGDGSPLDGSPNPTHVYENPGTYTALLLMTSSNGSSESAPITITANVDPNPKFYVRTDGSTGADCGPRADPCASISEAQANAIANGIGAIRVAGGNYSEPLSLVSGMDITGGWAQDFSDFGLTDVTTIYGTGSTAPVTISGVANSSISGVSVQGVPRTSGDAVGIVVNGSSSGIQIGDLDSPTTSVAGGTGPDANGHLGHRRLPGQRREREREQRHHHGRGFECLRDPGVRPSRWSTSPCRR